MGAWGYGVLDNDNAMDFMSHLAEAANAGFDDGVDSHPDAIFGYFFTKAKVERNFLKLEALVRKQSPGYRDEAMLVLGALAMAVGAGLTPERRSAIQAALARVYRQSLAEWRSPKARAAALRTFSRKLAEHEAGTVWNETEDQRKPVR